MPGPIIRQVKNNFSSGELDPRLVLRNDLKQHDNGAAQMTNVLILPQGGFTRRPGLEYIANTTTNQAGRLVSFEFSTTQTYLLVFTPGEFKVYYDDAGTVTLAATVTSSPISTLTADMIAEMTYVQSADTLLLFHEDLQPIRITRGGSHSSWTVSTQAFTNIPVYAFSGVTTTTPAATLTPSAVRGTITLTASAAVFNSGHVGQYINVNDGTVYVTGYTSTTVLRGKVQVELTSTSVAASGAWELETGYEAVMSSGRGWPRCGTFHDGRLYLGGLKSRPQTLLGSVVGEFFDFDLGLQRDSEAIDVTIDDDRVNAILHLFPSRHLQVFTTGGEFYLPQDANQPITPANVTIRKTTLHGSRDIRPISLDGATLFLDRNGKVLRQYLYSDVTLTYEAPNVSILASHLLNTPTKMVFRNTTSDEDAAYVYIVNSDGSMAALNFMREQEINGFSEIETDGTFEDVTVVDTDVYVIVKRNINGSDVRFVERFNKDYMLDASKLQTGAASASWSNLGHLNGEVCRCRADDYIVADVTPSSGSVTLAATATEVEVGLGYLFTVKDLPLDFGLAQGGTTTGEVRRVVKATLEIYQTRDILVNGYTPSFLVFDTDEFDAEAATLLKSGQYIVHMGGYDRRGQVTITQEQPLEATILGMVKEVKY